MRIPGVAAVLLVDRDPVAASRPRGRRRRARRRGSSSSRGRSTTTSVSSTRRSRPGRQAYDREARSRLPLQHRAGLPPEAATRRSAIFFYKGYLRNSPKAHNRVEVEQKIAALQKQLDDQAGATPPATAPPTAPRRRSTTTPPPRRRPRRRRHHDRRLRHGRPVATTPRPGHAARRRAGGIGPAAAALQRRCDAAAPRRCPVLAPEAARRVAPHRRRGRARYRRLVVGRAGDGRSVVRVHARRAATRSATPSARFRFRLGGSVRLHLPQRAGVEGARSSRS